MTDDDFTFRTYKNGNTDDIYRKRVENKAAELMSAVPDEYRDAATRLDNLVKEICASGQLAPGLVASMLIASGIGMFATAGNSPEGVRSICEDNLKAVYEALPR